MVPKRRLAADPETVEKVEAALAVVLPFPARLRDAKQSGKAGSEAGVEVKPAAMAEMAAAPAHGERPTLLPPAWRDWLRITLIVSVAVHAIVFLAFQMRFHDDLERAAGAAGSMSSDGTVTIPVDVVVESALPPAPTPKPEIEADEETPQPSPPQSEVVEETQPDPTTEQAEKLMPTPSEPVPAQQEAERAALPEEESAPPAPVETAKTPEAPAVIFEKKPSVTREVQKRETEKTKQAERFQEKQKSTRPSRSKAADPNRTAAANLNGNAGGGGAADTGGRAAISSYLARVRAHVERHSQEARGGGIAGVVLVRFALSRNGQVLSASLARGSGEGNLDQVALNIVRRASPFPPFPAELTQSKMDNINVPIKFELR